MIIFLFDSLTYILQANCAIAIERVNTVRIKTLSLHLIIRAESKQNADLTHVGVYAYVIDTSYSLRHTVIWRRHTFISHICIQL